MYGSLVLGGRYFCVTVHWKVNNILERSIFMQHAKICIKIN